MFAGHTEKWEQHRLPQQDSQLSDGGGSGGPRIPLVNGCQSVLRAGGPALLMGLAFGLALLLEVSPLPARSKVSLRFSPGRW